MKDWQRKIDLSQGWANRRAGTITIQQLAGIVSKAIEGIKKFGIDHIDEEAEELAWRFADFAKNDSDNPEGVEEFDYILSDLYDWGDQKLDSKWDGKKVCWIDTFGFARKTA